MFRFRQHQEQSFAQATSKKEVLPYDKTGNLHLRSVEVSAARVEKSDKGLA